MGKVTDNVNIKTFPGIIPLPLVMGASAIYHGSVCMDYYRTFQVL
jgi:hypothetical protein